MTSLTVPVRRPEPSSECRKRGRFLIRGEASGDAVFSNTPLSFMMGVDAKTGRVIDTHHPLLGTSLREKIVILPKGRGSCSGSGVILELLYLETAPSALIFRKMEDILLLGVLLADVLFSKSIPVLLIQDELVWNQLATAKTVIITRKGLIIDDDLIELDPPYTKPVQTTAEDAKVLRGDGCSQAAQLAMEVIVEFASLQGANTLIDITQVHIDACCVVGKTSLLVPQHRLSLDGRFTVPATCNSLDVDRQRWKTLGADPDASIFAAEIGDAYLSMGATMSFTCAPYLLDSKPGLGDQVGWGESNAVVFANSVLGARTQKYPDYLDVLIALTGRAPALGCHLDEGRKPQVIIKVTENISNKFGDSTFPLLGYCIGSVVGDDIPIVYGMERSNPGIPDLKAFGAGFATTSSAPMFHIVGVTPEISAISIPPGLEHIEITMEDLARTWRQLNTAVTERVDLISLGNPHFALEEFPRFIELIQDRAKHPEVDVIITMSQFVHQKANEADFLKKVEEFGAQIITDTCWCMVKEPVIRREARQIMTNSAKYAHYGPGVTRRNFHFGSLASCIEAACTGQRVLESTSWYR